MALEAVSLVFSVLQTLFATLQSSQQLKYLFKLFGYQSELESLEETIKTIKSVLLDAEAKEALTHQDENFFEKLKDAIYDADDLIDEFNTLAEEQQILIDESDRYTKKVRLLFSRFEKLPVRYRISKAVKKLQKRLDSVASDASKFFFKVDHQPILRKREESCSHLCDSIIGREKELDDVVSMLLVPDAVRRLGLSFITIVGMGGLGKTSLAQLVFQHESIRKEFLHRWWVCVADHAQRPLDVKTVLCKILDVAAGQDFRSSTMESVLMAFQKHLEGKKFLLVLDDVWNENRNEWSHLASFFQKGERGSCVIITTRSKQTALIAGNLPTYELKGLSEENAWDLFQKMAFEKDQKQAICHDVLDIGRAIAKKCAGVPLAIRAIGSLLFGQKIEKWRFIQERGIANILKDQSDIMPVLELSYKHLDTSMKSCFSFCAVFPKDSVIKKEKLIQLWAAQGYVEHVDEGQNMEDILEDYFLILLRRCFFQNIERDIYGEIVSCKMHDLFHDIAQSASGKEIYIADYRTSKLDANARHLNADHGDSRKRYPTTTKIRTCLVSGPWGTPIAHGVLANWVSLRVLDLKRVSDKHLRTTIGKLVHLRYLDLSSGTFRKLPSSITDLHNLQTLNLLFCRSLIKLPKEFNKLVKLRVLDLEGCSLSHMPVSMDKLTCLQVLTKFTGTEGSLSRKQSVGQLQDLGALKNLKGKLRIQVSETMGYVKKDDTEAGFISNLEHLKRIEICMPWYREKYEIRVSNEEEQLLEDLKPHPNVKGFALENYHSLTIPKWMRDEHLATSLPNVVEIFLEGCHSLRHLPSFSELPNLKSLVIIFLQRLEFMEDTKTNCGEATTSKLVFFPSLEKLTLSILPKLKGWWRGLGVDNDDQFPSLSELEISSCETLTSFPFCPTLRRLTLHKSNKMLQPLIKTARTTCTSTSSSSSSYQLKSVSIHPYARYLKSLPIKAFENLDELSIEGDEEVENLSELKEVLQSCSSSLKSLRISRWAKLSSISGGGFEHFTALETLYLSDLCNLDMDGEDDDDEGTPWKFFGQSLHHLSLRHLPKLVNLPKGMRHLITLQTLSIESCEGLKTIPEWISCLSSLDRLEIRFCEAIESMPEEMRDLTHLRTLKVISSQILKERCQRPNGEDWPNIQHIPRIDIYL